MKNFSANLIVILMLLTFSQHSNAVIIDIASISDLQTDSTKDFFNVTNASDIFGWINIENSVYSSKTITDFSTDIIDYRIQIGDYLWSSEDIVTNTIINRTAYVGSENTVNGDSFMIMLDYKSMFDTLADNSTTLIQFRELNGSGDRIIFSADWAEHAAGDPLNPARVTPPTVPEPSILVLFGLGLAGIGFTRRRRLS